MRGRRWLLIGTISLGAGLLAGCLRAPSPLAPLSGGERSWDEPRPRPPRSKVSPSAHAQPDTAEQDKQPNPAPSDYLVSPTPTVHLDVQPTGAVDKSAAKPVKPTEMRIEAEEGSSPPQPADPPEPRRETPPAAPVRAEAPAVRVLRALLDHQSEEEINEQLASYDEPQMREAMLVLLSSAAQLQQNGGIARFAPRDLAAWTDRLHALTESVRGRAQLILERTCFCCQIKKFGDFTPLPPEHGYFQPGEVTHVYVEVRNFSCRREPDRYVTVMKARMEIYDENHRTSPPITWISPPQEDVSFTPRQDHYINFQFRVPRSCPAGLHTLRITIEDWTDAPAGAKQVPESRIAQRTLDFRVGGPLARPARAPVAEAPPPG
jgi:hypothetical protein